MAAKVNRALAGALAGSLVAHLLLLGAAGDFGLTPEVKLEFPIEASLVLPPPPSAPAVPRRPAAPRAEPMPAPVAEPVAAPELPPAAEPVTARPPEAAPQSLPERPPEPPAPAAPAVVPEAPPAPAVPVRPALRELAEHLVIQYRVQTGDGEAGFVAGRATYTWQSRDGRYSLVSVLEATGLASLFFSGRIVQVSEGTVDGAGLHPAQYQLQRNERRQDVARFDWGQNRLAMAGRGGAVLTPQAQDLLSFPFHLAMTVRDGEPDFSLGVTNGRKFNEFVFRVVGRETVDLSGRSLETLHLRGEKVGEGTLDVWLDLNLSGLPVRVRTYDRKGKVAVMELEGLTAPGRESGD